MKRHHRVFSNLSVACLLAVLTAAPVFADADEDYEKMPGYVDFGELGMLGKTEPKVEVFLKGPLLKLAQEAVRHDEPELAAALESVKLIRVDVFPVDARQTKDLLQNTKKLATDLEEKGWEMAVRVREKDQDIYIYVLPGKNDDINGLVAMVIEDDEATFVNIVGTIDPEQIGHIARSMHIDGLNIPDLGHYGQDD